MKAQRSRYNHLDTTWTRSPRWNYSRFILEAGVMKKKASGMISPLAGCREELQIPQSRDDGGSGYRRFRGVLIGCLGFLYRGLLIGEGASQEVHKGVWPPYGASPSRLLASCRPR